MVIIPRRKSNRQKLSVIMLGIYRISTINKIIIAKAYNRYMP